MHDRISDINNWQLLGGFPSVVRNLRRPRAAGQLINFLDDDIVPAGHYEAIKGAFFDHPNLAIIFGKLEFFCQRITQPA
jgi:hypothetical protein